MIFNVENQAKWIYYIFPTYPSAIYFLGLYKDNNRTRVVVLEFRNISATFFYVCSFLC